MSDKRARLSLQLHALLCCRRRKRSTDEPCQHPPHDQPVSPADGRRRCRNAVIVFRRRSRRTRMRGILFQFHSNHQRLERFKHICVPTPCSICKTQALQLCNCIAGISCLRLNAFTLRMLMLANTRAAYLARKRHKRNDIHCIQRIIMTRVCMHAMLAEGSFEHQRGCR